MGKEREKFDGFSDIDAGECLRAFYFLSKAVAKGDGWLPMMQDIHIETADDGSLTAVSTDGRRMHVVTEISAELGKIFGFGPGEWKVISAKPTRVQMASVINRDQPFPNWKKIIPQEPAVYRTEFSGFSLSGRRVGVSSVSFAKLMREFPEVTPLNMEYLAAIDNGDNWKVSWFAPNKAVVFHRDSWSAYIMPMSAD